MLLKLGFSGWRLSVLHRRPTRLPRVGCGLGSFPLTSHATTHFLAAVSRHSLCHFMLSMRSMILTALTAFIFQVLAEHGVPGLIIFLALITSCYWSCRKLVRKFRDSGPLAYLSEYAQMVQLSMVSFLVSGAFLGRAYFDLLYQLVATVIILKSLAHQEIRRAQLSHDVGDETLPVTAIELPAASV